MVVFKEMWGMCPAHLKSWKWKIPESEIECPETITTEHSKEDNGVLYNLPDQQQ